MLDRSQGAPAVLEPSHAEKAHSIVGMLRGGRSLGVAKTWEQDTEKHDETDDGGMLILGDTPNASLLVRSGWSWMRVCRHRTINVNTPPRDPGKGRKAGLVPSEGDYVAGLRPPPRLPFKQRAPPLVPPYFHSSRQTAAPRPWMPLMLAGDIPYCGSAKMCSIEVGTIGRSAGGCEEQ